MFSQFSNYFTKCIEYIDGFSTKFNSDEITETVLKKVVIPRTEMKEMSFLEISTSIRVSSEIKYKLSFYQNLPFYHIRSGVLSMTRK